MVERIVRQLAQANENLTGNVVKTILTANKVKEQICMHEVVRTERITNNKRNGGSLRKV